MRSYAAMKVARESGYVSEDRRIEANIRAASENFVQKARELDRLRAGRILRGISASISSTQLPYEKKLRLS